jgi:hypothetical protein
MRDELHAGDGDLLRLDPRHGKRELDRHGTGLVRGDVVSPRGHQVVERVPEGCRHARFTDRSLGRHEHMPRRHLVHVGEVDLPGAKGTRGKDQRRLREVHDVLRGELDIDLGKVPEVVENPVEAVVGVPRDEQ